jgi:5-methylthioadenosine/S-adenosylhomocysteine deaminase
MTDLLLAHGTVVTMDPDRRIIEDGAVAITGDRIAAIASTAELLPGVAARVINCRGRAIIPGLVDAHGHAGGTRFRPASRTRSKMTHLGPLRSGECTAERRQNRRGDPDR